MVKSGVSLVRSGFRSRPSKTKAASNSAMRVVRPLLMERAGGLCEKCGTYFQNGLGHAHHRLRRRGPDLDVLSNLIALCPPCHAEVHSTPTLSRQNGWILLCHHLPAEEPVLYRGQWMSLTDSGLVTPTDV